MLPPQKNKARIKPKADFCKTGLADGIGGDYLGEKKCFWGVKALLSSSADVGIRATVGE